MEIFVGDTLREVSTGAVTETSAQPVTPPDVALMAVAPWSRPVARPVVFTETVDGAEELHWAVKVRSTLRRLVKVPLAVNCCVRPLGIDVPLGVTVID